MKKIKNVRLAFSCPEKTDSLNKNEKGFRCGKCSTDVIDFTTKSGEELKELAAHYTNGLDTLQRRAQARC